MKTILKNIIFFEYAGFSLIITMLWLNEILDIPHHAFGYKKTPVNYPESLFETVLVFMLGLFMIRVTRKMLKKIEEIAMYDPLTGLMNRRYIYEYLKHKSKSCSKRYFSLIMCDLDHFKRINDTYGHDCGDMVLSEVGRLIKDVMRPQDMISRWGGEEFVVILPEMDIEEAAEVAERIRVEIQNNRFLYQDSRFTITMSFGISKQPYHEMDPSKIIQEADHNLYKAKNSGRNRIVY